jgi:tetratricopeptide (TPR) repeat protein
MRVSKFFFIIVLAFPLIVCGSVPDEKITRSQPDSLLDILKAELSRNDIFDRKIKKRIAQLKKNYHLSHNKSPEIRYKATLPLFEIFQNYQFDSTYRYVQQLIILSNQMHDKKKLAENRLRLGTTLITAGMFKETFDCLHEINPALLDSNIKKSYYILYSWAYSDLAKYNADRIYAPLDLARKFRYLDSAIALCKPGSFEKGILEAQQESGKGPHPSTYFVQLSKRRLTLHEEAMVATGLSTYRQGTEKTNLLAKAALNDLRTSTYRALALLNLGKALHEQGKTEDAYFFLQQALSQANRFGGNLQRDQVIHMLSTVAAERDRIAQGERQRILVYLVCIIVFAIVTSLISFIIFVQFKKVRAAEQTIRATNNVLARRNQQLWEDGRIKEEYIGYFFNELSRYIIKLDKLKINAQRKAKSGSVDELLRLLDQVDIPSERHEFFATFDRIFLKLFPDFVEAVNAMFSQEDQIRPKSRGSLNPQLRIFALMRLGINKNEMIAGILQYTVNTVYTYRFRAKSKALVPSEDFEQRIMGIQVVDI